MPLKDHPTDPDKWVYKSREYMIEDDDDIQDYKKPWVGLTEEELYEIYDESDDGSSPCGVCGACSKCKIEVSIARAIQSKLKEKNT